MKATTLHLFVDRACPAGGREALWPSRRDTQHRLELVGIGAFRESYARPGYRRVVARRPSPIRPLLNMVNEVFAHFRFKFAVSCLLVAGLERKK